MTRLEELRRLLDRKREADTALRDLEPLDKGYVAALHRWKKCSTSAQVLHDEDVRLASAAEIFEVRR